MVKSVNPNIVIIIGGPEVDSHKNKNFHIENTHVDYTIYGDGEEAFSKLLDYLIDKNTRLINTVDSSGTVSEHRVFLNKTALADSPYIEYKNEYINYAVKLNNIVKEKMGSLVTIVPVWETTKGCPYACSFCDWSSGLHNKVRVWGSKEQLIPNWKKEVGLFFELAKILNIKDFNVYWTNPNIGLTPQDEEIVDFWCLMKQKIPNGPVIQNPQLSKLKKDVTYRILDKMLANGITNDFKFDVQDLNETVLQNINRPEIPWSEHKQYILNLKSKYRTLDDLYVNRRDKYVNRITFIWGLPGQTLDNLKYNITEAGTVRCYGHNLPFELLPNTPAYNDEYIKKYSMKFRKITILDHGRLFKSKIKSSFDIERAVVENYSLTERDYFTGVILYNIYSIFYSDYHKPIFGMEHKIFDNWHKIKTVIDRSYKNFSETGIVGLIDDRNQIVSIMDYFYNNESMMYRIFEFDS